MVELARNQINEGPGLYGDTPDELQEYNTRLCLTPLRPGPSD